jgi:cysteine desulfurase
LEAARTESARVLGVRSEEVYFTSGGTEANATIIQGVLRTWLEKGVKKVHVVSTSIEHSSILETLKLFERHGVKVTYVDPGPDGIVHAEDILEAIQPHTALVTCMYANNEIGTIQPVSKIGAGIRKIKAERSGRAETLEARRRERERASQQAGDACSALPLRAADFPVFHTDASQAPLWLSCEIEGLRADAMTLDAHKMQGPKGVGALVVRRHVSWEPLMAGGGQERGKRPTTESVELARGFTEALKVAHEGRAAREGFARGVQSYFFDQIREHIPGSIVNGSTKNRLPNNINISLQHISDPEMAVLFLDNEGIACSTKSSCIHGEEDSYVIRALGDTANPWRAKNTLRFTLAPDETEQGVDYIIKALKTLTLRD